MLSWPTRSRVSIRGKTPSNRCKSEPQIAQPVTLMMPFRPSSLLGSGTVAHRMSFFRKSPGRNCGQKMPAAKSVPRGSERQRKTRVGDFERTAPQETGVSASRPFAIVTSASTGIGFELPKGCGQEGCDLLIAADGPEMAKAAASLRDAGTEIEAPHVDLATTDGVDKLCAAAKGRQVDALLANAGRGHGRGTAKK
jgi:hypothetical protein